MKTKLSTRVIAWFVVSVMLISAVLVIPVSGEWIIPDWVNWWDYDDRAYAFDDYWSWEEDGTGMPDPNDPNDGLPYDWNVYHWESYGAHFNMSLLNFDQTSNITTAKAGDVVWIKVVLDNLDEEMFPDGVYYSNYCITFDHNKALPFMMSTTPCNDQGNTFLGELDSGDTWFRLCFQPTVKTIIEFDASMFMPLYNNNDYFDNYMLGLHIMTGTRKELKSGQAVWCFPMQLDEDLKDGEKITFTIPYPQQNTQVEGFASSGNNPNTQSRIQGAKGGAVTVTINNHETVDANIASGSSYAFSANEGDLDNTATGFVTDGKRPLTNSADYDVVEGNAYGKIDFRGPADVSGVTFTFNTNDTAALPTEVKAYGVTASGEKVLLGTMNEGTAVNKGIVNDENTNILLDGYEYSEYIGWDEEEIKVVNEANAYKFSLTGLTPASYVGLYFEATAADGKSIALGEVEVNGEYSKFDVSVVGGHIESPADAYVPGDEITITADVPADFEFVGWTLNDGAEGVIADATSTSTTFTVGATDAEITANYVPKKYALTVVDGTGSGDYAKDTTVNITAPAEIEIGGVPYVFSVWKITDGNATITDDTANETTVITNGVATIKAEYVIASYNLVVIDGSGSGTYDFGTEAQITANVIPEKVFIGWEIVSDSSDMSYVIDDTLSDTTIMVYGSVTVRALYEDKKYDLVVENGTGSGSYKNGDSFTITADAPADGMMFDKWVVVEGNATFDDVNNPETVITTSNVNTIVEATYRSKYNLVVNNGSGDGQYGAGETATIVADAPAEGYAFMFWEYSSSTFEFANGYDAFDEEAVIIINGDAEITAKYYYLYSEAPDNLALNSTITLDKGTTEFDISLIQDKLYPMYEEAVWPLFQSVDGTVQMTYALPGCYNVDKVVLNSGWLSEDPDAYFPNGVKIYGSNSADGSNAVLLLENKTLCVEPESNWEYAISVPEVPGNGNSYWYTLNIPEEKQGNFKYIIVEYACTWSNRGYTNEKLMLGEVEIYGEEANFLVEVINGSVVEVISGSTVEREDGYIGYTSGTVLQLKPNDDTELSVFDYWSGCNNGVLNTSDNTFTVGTGDAMIVANFADIHKPVPDNLVPGSTVNLTQGTISAGSVDYLADQLYPLTYGAKWTTIQREDGKVVLVLDLGDQYDVSNVALTYAYGPEDNVERPSSIYIYGANNADYSDKTSIAYLTNALDDAVYEEIEFEDGSTLVSVALRKDFDAAAIYTYRYVIVEMNCNLNATPRNPYSNEYIKIGEIEVYGNESQFHVEVQNGTMSPEVTDDLYKRDDVVTITANEIPDKKFIGWTVISGSCEIADASASTTTITVGTTSVTLVANYVDVLYKLTVVNGDGTGDYAKGTSVDLVAATPEDPELIFDKWVINDGNIIVDAEDLLKPEITITTDGVATITATYKNRIYGLTVEQGTGDGDYANNTAVTITADAPAANKKFDKWIIVTGDGTFVDATSATTTFTTSNESTTIRATYVDIPYDVTVQNGSIAADDVNEDGYIVGSVIEITADEIADKEFIGWIIVSGNGTFDDAKSETTTFTTASGDTVIKAEYADVLYDITVNNGSVSEDDVKEDGYVVGSKVTIVADDAPLGQEFVGWIITSGNGTLDDATSDTTELTVGSGGVVVEAVYEKIAYDVTVENGYVVGGAKDEYYYGDVVTIIANNPAEDMVFAGWTLVSGENAVISGNTFQTTVTVGTSDVVVRADYAEKLYLVDIESGCVAEDDYNENGYVEGAVIDIIADVPAPGYQFNGWVVVEGSVVIGDITSDTTTLTVGNEDSKIEATYVAIDYTLEIINGTAQGGIADSYIIGDEVVIIAKEIEGKEFTGWKMVSGDGATIDDITSDTAILTFGASNVVVAAEYKNVSDAPATGDRGIALYILLALITLCGATMLIYKKKA